MPVPPPIQRAPLREVLARRDQTSIGVELRSAGPASVEIAGSLAFDVLLIDALHAAVSPFSGQVESLLRAAGAHGASALVRVPELAAGTINRILNDGAHGVVIPEIDSAEAALRAADACRYPPRGRRGAAPIVRSANYGLTEWDAYRAAVNDETVVFASVETAAGLLAAAEIAAVPGIDGVLFESFPLAVVAGTDPNAAWPDAVAATAAIAAVRAAGKIAAATVISESAGRAWRDAGCTLIILADELSRFGRLAQELQQSLLFLDRTGGVRAGRSLRERIDADETLLGTFSTLVEAPYIELLGHAGFDFVITDCEESPGDSFGMQLEDLLRAAEAAGIATIVRPVENRAGAINRALNAGAEGVYVPHVRTVADCEAVVAAALYPPLGRRGAAPVVRAASFGTEGWDGYHARVNAQNLAMIMIEDLEGVENIEEIVKVPGLAGVLVGTWDLAVEAGVAAYGPPPPQVMAHVARVFDATVGAGLIMSAHCWSADAARKYQELGARILTVSLDSTLLIAALRQLESEGNALRG